MASSRSNSLFPIIQSHDTKTLMKIINEDKVSVEQLCEMGEITQLDGEKQTVNAFTGIARQGMLRAIILLLEKNLFKPEHFTSPSRRGSTVNTVFGDVLYSVNCLKSDNHKRLLLAIFDKNFITLQNMLPHFNLVTDKTYLKDMQEIIMDYCKKKLAEALQSQQIEEVKAGLKWFSGKLSLIEVMQCINLISSQDSNAGFAAVLGLAIENILSCDATKTNQQATLTHIILAQIQKIQTPQDLEAARLCIRSYATTQSNLKNIFIESGWFSMHTQPWWALLDKIIEQFEVLQFEFDKQSADKFTLEI